MSDDSGDLSDFVDPRPSGSKGRLRSDQQKKKRRIVMRIEFGDSDEETTSSSSDSCNDDDDVEVDDEQPSFSGNPKKRGRPAKQHTSSKCATTANTDDDSDQFRKNATKRRQSRRSNVLTLDDGSSMDGSSSGSEITSRVNKPRGKVLKKVIISEDEREAAVAKSPLHEQSSQIKPDDGGFTSDSSSNELLEKCPICLLTFRKQEIGSPATCAHIFCANCIEAWSKNVQTCPIDRNEFDRIVVRESFENRNIVREIFVDKAKSSKELELDDDVVLVGVEEDVTNCQICDSPEREEVMLLCDSCNEGYHIDCLTPALDAIPEGSWYCDNCFDSNDDDEADGVEEDLNMLFEDIRDMGIPQSRLRVTEVHQPRILRTRQNERIRAAVLRRTRASIARAEATTTMTTTRSQVGRPRTAHPATTTTTTTTTSTTRRKTKKRKPRTKRRRARQRTYVVEYDLNNFDEKFAIKTTKKVIRRRRRKRRTVKKSARGANNSGVRRTAKQRLAEQMGVNNERTYINPSHATGAPSLSLFGNANDLEYFSDSDQGGDGFENEIHIETGHGTAVQTSVRISNFGSQRSRKSLLLGRLQRNQNVSVPAADAMPRPEASVDILSNIMDMQDRWHTASRNLEAVHINADGTLQLPPGRNNANNNATNASTEQNSNSQNTIANEVTQAPMYPQGGGSNQNFNNSGSGRYSNNNFSNQGRSGGGGGGSGGGGGGSNQYRHSTGGMSSSGGSSSLGSGFNMVGRGNFSFSNPDYNSNQNQNQGSNFTAFNNRDRDNRDNRENRENDRFNPRNRQQQNNSNNNQRNSFPFNNMPQHQQQQPPQLQQQQQPPQLMENQLFGGLPPPMQQLPPPMQQLPPPPMQQLPPPPVQPMPLPPMQGEHQLFGGLPPPMGPHMPPQNDQQLFGNLPPPPIVQQHQIPPPQNEHQLFSNLPPPPTFEPQLPQTVQPHLLQSALPNMNIPPPLVVPVLRSAVPPPPAPPAALANWNSTLFSYAQDDDDDDSNCPNFSVYSAESQEVAKATVAKNSTNDGEVPKEDDENEDLVQLDDDDDIPMPPENNVNANSDLYEPENPTEEVDTENESENETDDKIKNIKEAEKPQNKKSMQSNEKSQQKDKDKESDEEQPIIAESENKNDSEYDPEEETEGVSNDMDALEPEKDQEEKEIEQDQEEDSDDEEHETEEELEKITEKDEQPAKDNDDDKEKDNTEEPAVDAVCDEPNDKPPSECDARSPSPEVSNSGVNKLQDADVTAANRKGVLELYDDSDWDELDIDRPRSTERMDDFITKPINEDNEKDKEKVKEKQNKLSESKDDKGEEEDRSYTPCLDEKNDPEDEPGSPTNGEAIVGGTPDLTPSSIPKAVENGDKDDSEEEEGIIHEAAEPVGVETELISEEDENVAATQTSRRRKEKRSRRKNERSETFKKVSSKRKERNYRTDKAEKRKERMRGGSLPASRSISRSRSRSISRSRSRSGSRQRSRSRSDSRAKSPRGQRRNRKRRSSRSPPLRSSRSRSNDKENYLHFHGYNQGHNNQGFFGRFTRGRFNNRFQNNPFNQRFQQRPRRREIQRYDVRNVVGHSRNFNPKDRYGRDTSRPPRKSFSRSISPARRRRSFSGSRSRSSSVSPKRRRRNSFSISPSPSAEFNRRSPRRSSFSPPSRGHQRNRRSPISHMFRRRSQSPQRGRLSSPPRNIRSSRSVSPLPRPGGRKVTRHMQVGSPEPARRTSRSISGSPRYTPRLSHSRSRSPRSMSPHKRQKNKKKKPKDRKKKKTKKRIAASKSPVPVRRISRQRDPYEHGMMGPAPPPKRKRHHSPQAPNNVSSPPNEEHTWSPSPSPPPIREYDNNVSWTPPLVSQHDLGTAFPDMFEIEQRRVSKPNGNKKEKRKRDKKKKKTVKRRETAPGRKEKRRTARRTETPEPAPSKEVFASGNNILVSVSFNKEAAAAAAGQPPQQQTTVVTLPPTREDVISGIQRGSTDRQVTTIGPKKKRDKNHKRKKLDTKPVAIIDLERSPFQVHQEPADIIVLTDSDAANEDDLNEHEHHRGDRHLSESGADEMEQHHHRPQRGNSSGGGGGRAGSQHDQTPPMLSTIMEESSYELQQTGPKTPPEPPVIKFTLLNKQQSKARNVLHDQVDDLNDDDMLDMEEEQREQQQHRQDLESMQSNQKIGPNTPPESGPCSPDVYDPFDPTKSPSLSPRSPTPPPLLLDKSQNSIGGDSGPEINDKHNSDESNRQGDRINQQQISSIGGASQNNATTLNPVELVMALMSSKQQASANQDMVNKSIESQYSVTSSLMISSSSAGHDDNHVNNGMQEKSDEANSAGGAGITVLSNVLITSSKSQHIPTISSPTPPMPTKSSQNLITKLPLPKVVTGSVGSGSGIGLPSNLRNGGGGGVADDSFNDIESPYSPGSADYEDLFEPPPDTGHNTKRRSKRSKEKFDNLFGSSSPVGYLRLPSYAPSSKKFKSGYHGSRKLKVAKVGKSGDEQIKVYDDVPNSAVELQVKDKFLRKLNRQERVVEEVKLVLKPRFNRKQITKEDYKEIMRRAVPKICHSRSGEINPSKIKNLIEAYVKKFRAKHKKLNIINTGQVSSAVKCAAYLKKL